MTTGRPTSEPMRLTDAEKEMAHATFSTDPNISHAEAERRYAEGKRRFLAEKAAGLHQNG